MQNKNESLFTISHIVPLSNKRLTKREVTLTGNKILFIARPEIGSKIPFEESLPSFKENLQKYIQKFNATDVFILGKLLGTDVKEQIEKEIPLLFNSLEDISTTLHILSANDERMAVGLTPTNLDVIKEYAGYFNCKISEDQEPKTFYVCDDMGNDVLVDVDAGCAYLIYLRENFTIPFKTFLISGHVSPAFIEIGPNVISPGKFNYEIGKIEYAYFDLSEGIEMEIFTDIDTEDFHEDPPARPTETTISKRTQRPISPDCTCYI